MKVRIESPRMPGRYANTTDIFLLLGQKHKWPDEGIPEQLVQGVRVYVTPAVRVPGRKSSKHRAMAICNCGQHVPCGRLHQHRCEEAK